MADLEFPNPEQTARFYAALGLAITNWAQLEDELFGICRAILGCTKERAAVVFYRTPTIDARLSLLEDLMATFFPYEPGEHPHPHYRWWSELTKQIRPALQIRNQLAHHHAGPMVFVDSTEDGSIRKITVGQASYMGEMQALRKRERPDPLDTTAIREHAALVLRISNEMKNFRALAFQGPP